MDWCRTEQALRCLLGFQSMNADGPGGCGADSRLETLFSSAWPFALRPAWPFAPLPASAMPLCQPCSLVSGSNNAGRRRQQQREAFNSCRALKNPKRLLPHSLCWPTFWKRRILLGPFTLKKKSNVLYRIDCIIHSIQSLGRKTKSGKKG